MQEFGDHRSPVVGAGMVVLSRVVVGPAGAESDHAEEVGWSVLTWELCVVGSTERGVQGRADRVYTKS